MKSKNRKGYVPSAADVKRRICGDAEIRAWINERVDKPTRVNLMFNRIGCEHGHPPLDHFYLVPALRNLRMICAELACDSSHKQSREIWSDTYSTLATLPASRQHAYTVAPLKYTEFGETQRTAVDKIASLLGAEPWVVREPRWAWSIAGDGFLAVWLTKKGAGNEYHWLTHKYREWMGMTQTIDQTSILPFCHRARGLCGILANDETQPDWLREECQTAHLNLSLLPPLTGEVSADTQRVDKPTNGAAEHNPQST